MSLCVWGFREREASYALLVSIDLGMQSVMSIMQIHAKHFSQLLTDILLVYY